MFCRLVAEFLKQEAAISASSVIDGILIRYISCIDDGISVRFIYGLYFDFHTLTGI